MEHAVDNARGNHIVLRILLAVAHGINAAPEADLVPQPRMWLSLEGRV